MREIIPRALYPVVTAASGFTELELASAYWIDVVIVEYVMPEMNGQEVAVEMRWLKPLAPIILLTEAGDVPEHRLNRGQSLGTTTWEKGRTRLSPA